MNSSIEFNYRSCKILFSPFVCLSALSNEILLKKKPFQTYYTFNILLLPNITLTSTLSNFLNYMSMKNAHKELLALTVAVHVHRITTDGFVWKSVTVKKTSTVIQSMVAYKTVG